MQPTKTKPRQKRRDGEEKKQKLVSDSTVRHGRRPSKWSRLSEGFVCALLALSWLCPVCPTTSWQGLHTYVHHIHIQKVAREIGGGYALYAHGRNQRAGGKLQTVADVHQELFSPPCPTKAKASVGACVFACVTDCSFMYCDCVYLLCMCVCVCAFVLAFMCVCACVCACVFVLCVRAM